MSIVNQRNVTCTHNQDLFQLSNWSRVYRSNWFSTIPSWDPSHDLNNANIEHRLKTRNKNVLPQYILDETMECPASRAAVEWLRNVELLSIDSCSAVLHIES